MLTAMEGLQGALTLVIGAVFTVRLLPPIARSHMICVLYTDLYSTLHRLPSIMSTFTPLPAFPDQNYGQ